MTRCFSRFQSRVLVGFALVVRLLALGQGQFGLDLVALPVQRGRDQRVAIALHPADQPVDLVPVQQQLAGAAVIGDDMGGSGDQRRDLRAEQEQLAFADHRVALADVGAAGADRLQLPALQREPGLEVLLEVVFVACALVQRDGLALSRQSRRPFLYPCQPSCSSPAIVADAGTCSDTAPMPTIRRPPWSSTPPRACSRWSTTSPHIRAASTGAKRREVLEAGDERMVARLDLGLGEAAHLVHHREHAVRRRTISTCNCVDGPFKRLAGPLAVPCAGRVGVQGQPDLDFEPNSKLLGPALAVGFQGLADRMVDDFVPRRRSRARSEGRSRARLAATLRVGTAGVARWRQRRRCAACGRSGLARSTASPRYAVHGVEAEAAQVLLRDGDRMELLRPLQVGSEGSAPAACSRGDRARRSAARLSSSCPSAGSGRTGGRGLDQVAVLLREVLAFPARERVAFEPQGQVLDLGLAVRPCARWRCSPSARGGTDRRPAACPAAP